MQHWYLWIQRLPKGVHSSRGYNNTQTLGFMQHWYLWIQRLPKCDHSSRSFINTQTPGVTQHWCLWIQRLPKCDHSSRSYINTQTPGATQHWCLRVTANSTLSGISHSKDKRINWSSLVIILEWNRRFLFIYVINWRLVIPNSDHASDNFSVRMWSATYTFSHQDASFR
jgi:hypothetical protein